jgi:hypothetical protein
MSQNTTHRLTKADQEDEIREAVIRYLAAGWSEPDRVFFISIAGKDPSDQFLQQLKGFTNLIKKVSESKDVQEENSFFSHVRDKETDKPGVVFSVGRINWLTGSTAEVEGSYRCGGLCGGGSKYRVKRTGKKWVVTPGKTQWNA